MLLRSVGRWSPGQLLAPSSWRSLNPPWLGYFFSCQWKITQRDPSAPFSYSHQVSKRWKDNLIVPHFQNPGVDSLILLTKLPKIGVQTIMMAKVKTASSNEIRQENYIMWSYSGLKWCFEWYFRLRWRPQCSRSSRRSSPCSSPSASPSMSSSPPPRYLYLYL